MIRNYLVCKADFPHECTLTDRTDEPIPAGRELAEHLHSILQNHTSGITEVWNHEDFGWSFNCDWENTTINVLIAFHDEERWLIIFIIVSLIPWFLRSRKYDVSLGRFCEKIDSVARADERFSDLRWFTPAEYAEFERPKKR